MNPTTFRNKLKKIHNKIDTIAKGGNNNVFEYYKYIDEIITNGDFYYLEQVYFGKYDININGKDIDTVKKTTWKKVLSKTKSSISVKIKKMYDTNDVYQVGVNIYSSNNVLLGKIQEVDTYVSPTNSLEQNREFTLLTGVRKIFLIVTKADGNTINMNIDVVTLSPEQNLLNRYTLAIAFLLTLDPIWLFGEWNDLGYWVDNSIWTDTPS